MPTISTQPSDARPVPKKECLKYCIIPTEAVLAPGTQAEATLEFDGTAFASGITFVFAGFEFRTSAATVAFDRFPITADALESASNFAAALALNAGFFGVVTTAITQPVPGTYRVTVTWNENGEQTPWDFDYSNFTPEPGHSETNGDVVTLREGFKLRYQLFALSYDGDLIEVTTMESITPRVTPISAIPRLCFDFMDDVTGLVGTTWPDPAETDIIEDEAFRIRVFLKYGGIQIENCEVTEFDFLASDTVWLVNSVFQIDNEQKIKPYIYPDATFPKFLTARPSGFSVRSNAYYWLWIYANNILTSADKYKYRTAYEFFDSAGLSLGAAYSASEPDSDGVYILPAGPANIPAFDPDAATVQIQLEVWQVPPSRWERASEVFTVRIDNGSCSPTEFHFLEDLGAYSILYTGDPVEVSHVPEAQVFELPEYCPDDVYASGNVADRVRMGGRSRANIRSHKRYRCEVTGYDTEETEEWFRQFADSEDIKHRYATAEGMTVFRNIVIEAEETTLRKDGEYLTLAFVFRYHTDLR